MRNYSELGIEIVQYVYMIENDLPENENFCLRSKIKCATVFIPPIITKGNSRWNN